MTVTVRVERDEVTPHLDSLSQALSPSGIAPALAEVADEFVRITKENMGDSGIDRPHEWENLSPKYAKRVKRTHATLVLDGTLRDSIKADSPAGYSVKVGSDVVYADAHQHGRSEGNLPDRPYFPDQSGEGSDEAELTPYAEQQLEQVLADAIEKLLNS